MSWFNVKGSVLFYHGLLNRCGNRCVCPACHVIKQEAIKSCTPSNITHNYQITTADGKSHQPIPATLKLPPADSNTDLATIKFTSDRTYTIAKLVTTQNLTIDSTVYASGYPADSKKSGYLAPGFNASRIGQFYLPPAGVINAKLSQKRRNGYTLNYSILTLKGMSGGPVLNSQGELIAIHGEGGISKVLDSTPASSNSNSTISSVYLYKTNRNWGIPIDTYRSEFLAQQPLSSSNQSNAEGFYAQGVQKLDNQNVTTEQIQSSIADFDRAIAANPNYNAAYIARADAYQLLGIYIGITSGGRSQIQQAIQDYSVAIKNNPSDPYVYLNRGYAQLNTLNNSSLEQLVIDLDRAITDFDKAITILPNYSLPYALRGYIKSLKYVVSNVNNGRDPIIINKALEDLNTAITLDPNQGFIYVYRARVYTYKQDLKNAQSDIDRAIAIDSRWSYLRSGQQAANGWHGMALAGEDEKAILEIIRERPKDLNRNVFVLSFLMGVKLKVLIDSSARADYLTGDFSPTQKPAARSHQKGVLSLLKGGDSSEAIAHFSEAIRLDSEYAEAYIGQNYLHILVLDRKALPGLKKAASIFQKRRDITRHQIVRDFIIAIEQS